MQKEKHESFVQETRRMDSSPWKKIGKKVQEIFTSGAIHEIKEIISNLFTGSD